MPISPTTVATFVTATSTQATSTASTPLLIDIDGDGKVDVKVPTSNELDIQSHLELIRAFIGTLSTTTRTMPVNLLKRLERVSLLVSKDRNKRAERIVKFALQNVTLSRGMFRRMSESDRQTLSTLLDSMLTSLEKALDLSN